MVRLRSAGRMLLAVGAALLAVPAYGQVRPHVVREPVVVDITVSNPLDALDPDREGYAAVRDRVHAEVHEAVRANPRQLLVLRFRDLPLEFDALTQERRAALATDPAVTDLADTSRCEVVDGFDTEPRGHQLEQSQEIDTMATCHVDDLAGQRP